MLIAICDSIDGTQIFGLLKAGNIRKQGGEGGRKKTLRV